MACVEPHENGCGLCWATRKRLSSDSSCQWRALPCVTCRSKRSRSSDELQKCAHTSRNWQFVKWAEAVLRMKTYHIRQQDNINVAASRDGARCLASLMRNKTNESLFFPLSLALADTQEVFEWSALLSFFYNISVRYFASLLVLIKDSL